MVILTHPANKMFLNEIHKRAVDILNNQGIIPSRRDGIPIIYSEAVSRYVKRKVKGKAVYDRFVSHEPTDWEIFAGFCEPDKYEDTDQPHFIFHNVREATVYKPW